MNGRGERKPQREKKDGKRKGIGFERGLGKDKRWVGGGS